MTLVRALSDFLIGFKTTKPLSQNTGIETIHPIINIASSDYAYQLFLPLHQLS